MAINKVIYGNTTLMDITDTTATASTIITGYGAYGADGVWIDGTAPADTSENTYYIYTDSNGYIQMSNEMPSPSTSQTILQIVVRGTIDYVVDSNGNTLVDSNSNSVVTLSQV